MSKWLSRTVLVAPYLKLCTTEKQYLKAAKEMKVVNPLPFMSETAGARVHTFTRGEKISCVVCIEIDKKRSMSSIAALLAHEAVHVAQELFSSIGEDRPGREIEAYAVQNILFQLLTSYESQAKRKKV